MIRNLLVREGKLKISIPLVSRLTEKAANPNATQGWAGIGSHQKESSLKVDKIFNSKSFQLFISTCISSIFSAIVTHHPFFDQLLVFTTDQSET